MGLLNPQIVLDFQTNVSTIIENTYAAFQKNAWWQNVAKVRTSDSLEETIAWMIQSAMIRDQGSGGNFAFEQLAAMTTTIENKYAGAALEVSRAELEDKFNGIPGGKAFQIGAAWAEQMGEYMGYWPQKQTTYILKNGTSSSLVKAYDGKALFATDHPVNPGDLSITGTFSNLFVGSGYRIDSGVTADVALANLTSVYAAIRSIKMPNGEDPRYLEPEFIVAGPALFPRAVQLTNARFLAQAASSGGGSGDVEAFILSLGLGQPIQAPELAGFESDTTYFVVARQARESQLGGIVYQERQPFSMDMFSPQQIENMAIAQKYRWLVQGRNAIAPGHPYLIFKCAAA